MKHNESFDAVRQFDTAPDAMLLDIPTACAISSRSRASIYRHFKAGDLNPVKVGNSTRIKVSDLRRLIGASNATA
jgi:hypothetical protein